LRVIQATLNGSVNAVCLAFLIIATLKMLVKNYFL